MENGWVKLYRKLLFNDLLRTDETSYVVFTKLLMLVDKNNGTWKGGRRQLSYAINRHESTIYKSLKRLEKHGAISLSSNSKFTTISICKWGVYQAIGEQQSNSKVTADEQQSNTLTRIENKKKNIYLVELQEQLRRLHAHACKEFGKNPNQYKLSDARKRLLKLRLQKFSEDDLMSALTTVSKSPHHRGDNERGWEADPYWIFKSYEKTEEWVNKFTKIHEPSDLSKLEIEV